LILGLKLCDELIYEKIEDFAKVVNKRRKKDKWKKKT